MDNHWNRIYRIVKSKTLDEDVVQEVVYEIYDSKLEVNPSVVNELIAKAYRNLYSHKYKEVSFSQITTHYDNDRFIDDVITKDDLPSGLRSYTDMSRFFINRTFTKPNPIRFSYRDIWVKELKFKLRKKKRLKRLESLGFVHKKRLNGRLKVLPEFFGRSVQVMFEGSKFWVKIIQIKGYLMECERETINFDFEGWQAGQIRKIPVKYIVADGFNGLKERIFNKHNISITSDKGYKFMNP